VIDKKLYKQLRKSWKGKVYQKYEEERKRFEHFSKYVGAFKGKDVLEIGPNAGVQSLEICQYANHWIGVEPDSGYYKQLNLTMAHTKCPTLIVNSGLKEYCEKYLLSYNFNALYTSFVLYHLSDEEVNLLRAKILPCVSTWIVYNRTKRPTVKNSWKFEQPEQMIEFVSSVGFCVSDPEWGNGKEWSFFKAVKP